jgi:Zn-finger protein
MTEQWEGKHYSYFCNKDCEYFPCHQTENIENFNCLFCYCPLYVLGEDCGGNFHYLSNGYKDCTNCLFPHKRENYGKIVERYGEIIEAMHKNDKNYQ